MCTWSLFQNLHFLDTETTESKTMDKEGWLYTVQKLHSGHVLMWSSWQGSNGRTWGTSVTRWENAMRATVRMKGYRLLLEEALSQTSWFAAQSAWKGWGRGRQFRVLTDSNSTEINKQTKFQESRSGIRSGVADSWMGLIQTGIL
jgi:hypothetical protein